MENPAACPQSQELECQPRVIKTIEITNKESLSTVGRTTVQRKQRTLKKVEVSDLEESADGNMRVKWRKGRHATGERKVYNMRQRNKGDIDFEAGRFEDHTFAVKQGGRGYSPADKHAEQPDLTLGSVECIECFPKNISSLLGTTIRNNNDNQNIVGWVK